MRIHLGHHFYGAGNLGDDFMLAGFLAARRRHAPGTSLTACVPFERDPLQRRFPEIDWLPHDDASRDRAIAACDVWLGLGGSPFQHAQSRWFVDHLLGETRRCTVARKPMFYLGVGVQSASELADPDVRHLAESAAALWTRDAASADRLRTLPSAPPVAAAADLAHLLFREIAPPAATPGRVTLVANFDFGPWAGQAACLSALARLPAAERVWLVQETRDLPGAERRLFAALPPALQAHWRLLAPDLPGAALPFVLDRWPSGEWLVSARYHAALAGAWAGSRIVLIATNEKLRGAAAGLGITALAPDASEGEVSRALAATAPAAPPLALATAAEAACVDFFRRAAA